MATETAIAIRKAEAQERVTEAAKKIARATSVGEELDLAPTHKDANIQGAIQVEALADYLEALAAKLTKKSKPEPAVTELEHAPEGEEEEVLEVDPDSEILGTAETTEGVGEGIQLPGAELPPVVEKPKDKDKK